MSDEKPYFPRKEICPCCKQEFICYRYDQEICLRCLCEQADLTKKHNYEDEEEEDEFYE